MEYSNHVGVVSGGFTPAFRNLKFKYFVHGDQFCVISLPWPRSAARPADTSPRACVRFARSLRLMAFCALCGKQCRGGKQTIEGSFKDETKVSLGLPPAAKLQRHLDPAWLKLACIDALSLPDGVATGWLHDERTPKDCYRRVKAAWKAVGLEQVRALPRPPTLPRPSLSPPSMAVGRLTIAPPSLLVPLPPAGAGEHRRADSTRASRRHPA